MDEYQPGDLVWFDPGLGYLLPGEVTEFSRPAQVVIVKATINGKVQDFTLTNLESVKKRQDLGEEGYADMVDIADLNEASLLWNLKIRYDKEMIYTYIGSILVSVNPYKMSDMYGMEVVKRHEGQILGTLPPHLFAIGSAAYAKMSKDNENQVIVISGESGAGKTENTKLLMQYLAAVNKSASNLVTEQILEASPLLEAFGNAKTVRNDNSSRFGKYLEVHFKDGVITGARTTEYLLEKSRIVTQAQEERNYHVFYEMLAGLTDSEKEKYGLQTAQNYFYMNQGGAFEIPGKKDEEDFRALLSAMQVLGITSEEQDVIFRMLASVLHLGNVYFHRKQLKHGQEGVEIGSDSEIRWASHLLQLSVEGITRALTTRTTEARNEKVVTPLNIDQALDARDAIAKALYSCLFSWLVQRINHIVYKGSRKTSIAILDIFGFEDFKENSFEQLCINYANETLQAYFTRHVFRLEQQEYSRERIEWQPLPYQDNTPVIHLIAKKPVGLLPLLDDESNFPKATDLSFLEKCHYNHALNELYSRPRMSSMEFGIRHYAGQVWYSVDGFLDKNRDTLRSNVLNLLISSRLPMISKMFQEFRQFSEASKTMSRNNGRFVTMKPRTPTVAARFNDSLQALVEIMSKCTPWFIRCIKPNNEKAAMKFDIPVVLEQVRYSGVLETVKIRKLGYPIRLKFSHFAERYRCVVPGRIPRGAPYREMCKVILDKVATCRDHYQLGTSKVFLRESLEQRLERTRVEILGTAAVTIQRCVRRHLAQKRYRLWRESAIKIQAAFRAWRQRKKYVLLKKGVIRAQATYRMLRQKREYEEIKAILARRAEAEKVAKAKAKERMAKEELDRASRAVAGVNHLEIPAELAFIFSKLEEWQCIHNERNISKCAGPILPPAVPPDLRMPLDIDQYGFSKFTNIYFKAHIWGMKREPIKTPFLAKSSESDQQESLAIFKLILRFMNDTTLSGKKERVLADYIVQKGLQNPALRDEIFCQLCNQTWRNENDLNCERGWLLLSNCLGAFSPSPTLYKYLLKYVSDHGHDGYKAHCQHKLLQGRHKGPYVPRTYPPSALEWKSNTRKAPMALSAYFPDGGSATGPLDSWTTGEEFAASLIQARGIDELEGWTIDLHDAGNVYGLNGDDYVFDLVSEMELPPAFPVCKSYFLVSADKTTLESSKSYWTSSPHNPDKVNVYEVDVEVTPPAPVRRKTIPLNPKLPPQVPVRESELREKVRARNEKMASRSHAVEETKPAPPATEGEIVLSKSSALNERYFEGPKGKGDTKQRNEYVSKSQQPPLTHGHSGEEKHTAVSTFKSKPVTEALSETSKLNKRYIKSKSDHAGNTSRDTSASHPTISSDQRPGTSQQMGSWQEDIPLASSSALNDRYFAQRSSKMSTRTECSDVGSSRANLSMLGTNAVSSSQDRLDQVNGGSSHRGTPEIDDNSSRSSPLTSNSSNPEEFQDLSRINGADLDDDDDDDDQETTKSRTSEPTRYVKYGGRGKSGPYVHSTRAHIDKTRDSDYERARSSAMSDTSETPSLASHVRNIRAPSHTSDVDQYVDSLFIPVLGGNLDEMSDARSLAASFKGDDNGDEFSDLRDPEKLSLCLKGGGDSDARGPSMTMSPPMVAIPGTMPNGETASLPMFNMAGMTVPMVDSSQLIHHQYIQQQMFQIQQRAFLASAFQQNLQIQQQLMHQNQALQQLLQTGNTPNTPTSAPHSFLAQSPLLSEGFAGGFTPGAFPALMTPNSSFTTPLLQTFPSMENFAAAGVSTPNAKGPTFSPPPLKHPSKSPADNSTPKDVFTGVLNELKTRAGGEDVPSGKSKPMRSAAIPPPPPPPPPPPTSPPLSPDSQEKYQNVYGRAKTVRIGKWRWPPPREEGGESTFDELKARKSHEGSEDMNISNASSQDTSNSSGSHHQNGVSEEQKPEPSTSDASKIDENDIIKSFQIGDNRPPVGSIGKLKISSEMKAKLEQLTIDHSVRSTHKDSRKNMFQFSEKKEPPVKKLDENRKAMLERQLNGSNQDRTDSSPPKPKSSGGDRKKIDTPPLPGTQDARKEEGAKTKEERSQFVVENLVKSQVEKMERASREIREFREELGHPLMSRSSMQQADFGFNAAAAKFYHQQGRHARAFAYEETLVSSRGPCSSQDSRSAWYPAKHASPTFNHSPAGPMIKGGLLPAGAPSSIAPSSTYYAPSTPVVPRHRELPPPRIPPRLGSERSQDKIEFVESSEFLRPMEAGPPSVLETADLRALEKISTKLFPPPPATAPHFTYTKVSWELHVRKEVFLPNEQLSNPLAIHLVFCQVVQDVYSPTCLRLHRKEKHRLKQLIESYGITFDNLQSHNHKLAMKKGLIEQAKECPSYFNRFFPISGGKNLPNVQMLGVSHSGVRLICRERDAICDYLRVLDTLSYEDITEVTIPKASTVQILLRNGGWMTLYSPKAHSIRNIIERFCAEAALCAVEYVRAVTDYITRESSLLSFQKGDIIRLVKNRNLHLERGWLYGVLDTGEAGIFPCEYVTPLGIRPENGYPKNGHRSPESPNPVVPTQNAESHTWIEELQEQEDDASDEGIPLNQMNDGRYSLLQFALYNFKDCPERYEMLKNQEESKRGSVKLFESLKFSRKNKKDKTSAWTWKELVDLVKFSKSPLQSALLRMDEPELDALARELFLCIMVYMGDYPPAHEQADVEAVYTILVNCHKYSALRDELYCQIMKQTTNNKSTKPDSCIRGWRLFSLVTAYFQCSEALKPYLIKYLETAAYDKRRACHGTAMVCLQNLRKTFKYGGRKNVPGIEEVAAISAGRNHKRQMYRLPGSSERIINTKSVTVVQDVIEEICSALSVRSQLEMEEFSLYCIIEGDPYTMALSREEYILDVTTELQKAGTVFYLIFCRSVWFFPLRLDNALYAEVAFNQVVPDYLEGLLLEHPVPPQSALERDVARAAALLHRASGMTHSPAKEEIRYLIPKPVVLQRGVAANRWMGMVLHHWEDMEALTTTEAKAQFLDILQKWPLFGSCFFVVKVLNQSTRQFVDHVLALNKDGIHFLDIETHKTMWKCSFSEVLSTRKVRAENCVLFLDLKCGDLMVHNITRIQTDQAHEVSRLIKQYMHIEQRHRGGHVTSSPGQQQQQTGDLQAAA